MWILSVSLRDCMLFESPFDKINKSCRVEVFFFTLSIAVISNEPAHLFL